MAAAVLLPVPAATFSLVSLNAPRPSFNASESHYLMVSWSSMSFVNTRQPHLAGIPSQRRIVAMRYREQSGGAVGLFFWQSTCFSRVSLQRQRISNDPV
jgi:hypothetical protein